MKKMKRLLIYMAIIVVLAVGGLLYAKANPRVILGKAVSDSETHKEERLMITCAALFNMKINKRTDERVKEVSDWSNQFLTKLTNDCQGRACDIRLSGEMKDGKTTITYSGTYIDAQGNTVPVKESKTFDFKLCGEKDFLK